jgi:hypothetical protein
VVPNGVTLKGEGVESKGQEPRSQASIYSVNTASYKVEIAGSIPAAAAADAQSEDNGPSLEEVSPKILQRNMKWILALALGILALGFIVLYRAHVTDRPDGLIRYVLLAVSHPVEPTTPQTFAFLNDILPELKSRIDGTEKIACRWLGTKPMGSVDMTALAIETFGKGVANNNIYTYRTLHLGLKGGEAKCLVAYDASSRKRPTDEGVARHAARPESPHRSTKKPTNLSVGDLVPVSGTYRCTFCSNVLSSIRGPLAGYAKGKGLNSSEIDAVFAAVGGAKTPRKVHFTKGETFGGCPECGDAARWSLE